MNILFITGIFAKNERDTALGGMAHAVYKSAIGMQERGHKVRILTIDSVNERWKYQGVDIISIKAKHGIEEKCILNSALCIINREYKIEKVILRLHKEEPVDIIQYTGWFGIGLLHFFRIPAVMRISSYTKIQLEYNYDKAKRRLFEIAEYLAAERMNYIFAPSRIMAEGLERDIKKRVGIIETPFMPDKVERDLSLLNGILKDKKYILYFGRMSVDKGILVIRDILHRTLKQYSEINFVFAGSSWMHNGEDIQKELLCASKECKNRVFFLGYLPKKKLLPIIDNAEMVLIPSLADNFPNSCAEAMALGKIVIGTNGSSLEQFICDGENGFLAEIGSAESLYSCIEKVLNMKEAQKRKMTDQAKRRVEKLDLRHYSRKMELLYNKVIKES